MFLFDLRTKIEIPFQTLIILSSKFVEKERIWKKRVYPNLNVKLYGWIKLTVAGKWPEIGHEGGCPSWGVK